MVAPLAIFLVFVSSRDNGGSTVVFALAALSAILVGLWIHQFGHMLASWAVGLKMTDFYFWPYRVFYKDKWKVTTVKVKHLLSDAGPALTTVEGMRGKMAVALLGGPILTLVTSSTALYCTRFFPSDLFPFHSTDRLSFPFWTTFGGYFSSVLGVLGLGYFVLTVLPIREYSRFWDGVFLRELAFGGERSERILAQHALCGIANDVRPRDWPVEWIEKGKDVSVSNDGLNWIWQAYTYHLDRGEMDEAKGLVDEGVGIGDTNPVLHSGFIRMEKVFLWLWLDLPGLEDPRAYFDEHRGSCGDWKAGLRAEAMLHLFEGSHEKAIECAVRGRDYIKKYWNHGSWEMSRDIFEEIIERAFAAQGAQVAPPASSGAEPGVSS